MGLGRLGQLADFCPRSGRREAGCPQRPSPYPHPGRKSGANHDFPEAATLLLWADTHSAPAQLEHYTIFEGTERMAAPMRRSIPPHPFATCVQRASSPHKMPSLKARLSI
jgi:hypothetical protein